MHPQLMLFRLLFGLEQQLIQAMLFDTICKPVIQT